MIASASAWSAPPSRLTLAGDEIHVWRAPLDGQTQADLDGFAGMLSRGETARASRFHFAHDRDRFVAARGILRCLLSRYLAQTADHLKFRYGPKGKPLLADSVGDGTLCFNLSHSNGLALYAVARGRQVGIDVEWMRRSVSYDAIAARFFTPHEAGVLAGLPPAQRLEAFFRCWTRKEAYTKARGEGLTLPLDAFEVSVAPDEPARLRSAPHALHWSLYDVAVGGEYQAALVVEGHSPHLMLRQFQWSSLSAPWLRSVTS